MIIFIYILIRIILIAGLGFLIWAVLTGQDWREIGHTLRNGFMQALRNCGFYSTQTRYPIELYKWIVLDEEDVSDECLERSIWPEMDIADWMQAGLPNTPEGPCQRGENCKCKLILYKQTKYPQNTN